MKKYILLLIAPLLFFNSCEEDSNQENDTNSVSIIGTWVDNIDGGWIVTAENLSDSDGDGVTSHINYNGSVIDVIQLENINYSLVDGAYNTFYGTENDLLIFGDCGCKDPDDGMLGYQGANTFSTNDGGASRIIYNTWDPEQDEISYSFPYFDPNSNDACLKFKCGNQTSSVAINWPLEGSLTFLGPGTEYHEKLTFFDNGTYTYQVSPVIWKKECGSEIPSFGNVLGQIPMQPYQTCSTGSYSYNENLIVINGLSFSIELNGDNLTLDRSQIGSEEYITTWERQ